MKKPSRMFDIIGNPQEFFDTEEFEDEHDGRAAIFRDIEENLEAENRTPFPLKTLRKTLRNFSGDIDSTPNLTGKYFDLFKRKEDEIFSELARCVLERRKQRVWEGPHKGGVVKGFKLIGRGKKEFVIPLGKPPSSSRDEETAAEYGISRLHEEVAISAQKTLKNAESSAVVEDEEAVRKSPTFRVFDDEEYCEYDPSAWKQTSVNFENEKDDAMPTMVKLGDSRILDDDLWKTQRDFASSDISMDDAIQKFCRRKSDAEIQEMVEMKKSGDVVYAWSSPQEAFFNFARASADSSFEYTLNAEGRIQRRSTFSMLSRHLSRKQETPLQRYHRYTSELSDIEEIIEKYSIHMKALNEKGIPEGGFSKIEYIARLNEVLQDDVRHLRDSLEDVLSKSVSFQFRQFGACYQQPSSKKPVSYFDAFLPKNTLSMGQLINELTALEYQNELTDGLKEKESSKLASKIGKAGRNKVAPNAVKKKSTSPLIILQRNKFTANCFQHLLQLKLQLAERHMHSLEAYVLGLGKGRNEEVSEESLIDSIFSIDRRLKMLEDTSLVAKLEAHLKLWDSHLHILKVRLNRSSKPNLKLSIFLTGDHGANTKAWDANSCIKELYEAVHPHDEHMRSSFEVMQNIISVKPTVEKMGKFLDMVATEEMRCIHLKNLVMSMQRSLDSSKGNFLKGIATIKERFAFFEERVSFLEEERRNRTPH